ncbi:MAG: helicase-related protein [Lachnospiraceae bacterium]
MENKQELIKVRDEYIGLIKTELLGPGSEISIPDAEHELISDAPNTRYSIGVLYAQKKKMNADNNDTGMVEEVEAEVEIDDEDRIERNQEEAFIKHNFSVSSSDEDNLDEEIGLAAQNMPSSMGITFFVKGDCEKVCCRVCFATYRKAVATDCRIPFEAVDYILPNEVASIIYIDKQERTLRLTSGGLSRKNVRAVEERDCFGGDEYGVISLMYKLSDQLSKGYVREPHETSLLLDFGESEYIDQNREIDGTSAKVTALRRKIKDDIYSITVMLVNDEEGGSSAKYCLYQPEIIVETKDNTFSFVEYSGETDFELLDEEEKSLILQYRNKKVYGTGLGTSVGWEIDDNGNGKIYNDFFPEIEVPSMDFKLQGKYNVKDSTLSMKHMSDLDDTEKQKKIAELEILVLAYENWIEEIKSERNGIDKLYHEIADKNIRGCEKSAERMRNGIAILKENSLAWDSFQLANRGMFMQRVHLKLQEKMSNVNRYPDDEELSKILDDINYYTIDNVIEDFYSWRPFQLAFLLMSMDSIVNDKSEDRDLVDLIWFPTGGGKTEAYLGLTAFTIFYRRLARIEESGGTAVIMRYTLRLLAAQQFTRASTLICACEYIRVDATSQRPIYGKYPLGDKAISIGLWIGGEHTPNKNAKAKEELTKLNKASASELDYIKDRHNKFQVLKCPWCGTKLVKDKNEKKSQFGYRMRNNAHFEIFCPQESCFFNQEGKLPIQIVDEELYATPPTLLFGTVDKFAMLPWNAKIGAFFAANSTNRAPELIIQDELHLISGPLGTMVGLFEAAIDAICRNKGIKTKIIASTATIRRAAEQCTSLYDRKVCQFPHPGINAEDSFFARESIIDYEQGIYGRKYVGLMPSGKTKAMMEIRSIAAMLQKIHEMDLSDNIKDKFWTLTVYFNSLKDLGKCSTLVDDDVKDFIKRMAYRLGSARDARIITSADELTSRVSTTQLNETLDKLEKLCYSQENLQSKRWPINVLLATNMISVGIDVARLNVMLLVGQPKLTSEYIQASSRVGRSFPGVAFTMYDGSKSRDRSHYEQFKSYHESFYKHVEPTGVTPFSKPARERALHSVVISLLRQLLPELSAEKSAVNFSREKYQKEIDKIIDYLVDRNNNIISMINPNMDSEEDDIRQEIDYIFEKWESLIDGYDEEHFSYGEKYMVTPPDEGEARLLKAYNTSKFDQAFDTMMSMRNVDVSVGSSVLIWED